ncbi:MAG: phosphoribosylaminoimidazolesuccinocarboxamide synthase [Candidatus Limnocylindrales bacterium]|nr:phosphoribosylaminoimidazolesuccinocarboxamide synthase [Candidatus Limnocylindrales bacterium]
MLAEAFLRSGKVRDLYSLPGGRLVLTASDRISAFDVVLPSSIPDKGRVLTGLSRFWFAETAGIVPNHLLDTDVDVLRDAFAARSEARWAMIGSAISPEARIAMQLELPLDHLRGRVMICRPTQVVPIEAVVRGYLAGSGWKEYRERGTVCGIPLPTGLRESDQLPEPIFTPATKAELGEHDENISFDQMVEHLGAHSIDHESAAPLAEAIRERALALYRYGAAIAARRGILLADTKFEFGLAFPIEEGEPDGPPESHLILIDEVLTPDSSRFWDAASYEPGRPQASFDKQFVRDWLETQPWDKTAPGPELPPDVIEGTRARYIEAYERITGASFARYLAEDVIAP